jgi:hypothetical protein
LRGSLIVNSVNSPGWLELFGGARPPKTRAPLHWSPSIRNFNNPVDRENLQRFVELMLDVRATLQEIVTRLHKLS